MTIIASYLLYVLTFASLLFTDFDGEWCVVNSMNMCVCLLGLRYHVGYAILCVYACIA